MFGNTQIHDYHRPPFLSALPDDPGVYAILNRLVILLVFIERALRVEQDLDLFKPKDRHRPFLDLFGRIAVGAALAEIEESIKDLVLYSRDYEKLFNPWLSPLT